MFDNIHGKVNIPNQEKSKDSIIIAKKAGRPKDPNMEQVQIKIDKAFHAEVKNYAKKFGVSKSSLITIALKSYLEKSEKKYKLIEV